VDRTTISPDFAEDFPLTIEMSPTAFSPSPLRSIIDPVEPTDDKPVKNSTFPLLSNALWDEVVTEAPDKDTEPPLTLSDEIPPLIETDPPTTPAPAVRSIDPAVPVTLLPVARKTFPELDKPDKPERILTDPETSSADAPDCMFSDPLLRTDW
jgi:hypothetical protein